MVRTGDERETWAARSEKNRNNYVERGRERLNIGLAPL
jgi:hypothetical protein